MEASIAGTGLHGSVKGEGGARRLPPPAALSRGPAPGGKAGKPEGRGLCAVMTGTEGVFEVPGVASGSRGGGCPPFPGRSSPLPSTRKTKPPSLGVSKFPEPTRAASGGERPLREPSFGSSGLLAWHRALPPPAPVRAGLALSAPVRGARLAPARSAREGRPRAPAVTPAVPAVTEKESISLGAPQHLTGC